METVDRVRSWSLFRAGRNFWGRNDRAASESLGLIMARAGFWGEQGLLHRWLQIRFQIEISIWEMARKVAPPWRHGLENWLDGHEDTFQRGRLSSGCQWSPQCSVGRSPGAVRPCLLCEFRRCTGFVAGPIRVPGAPLPLLGFASMSFLLQRRRRLLTSLCAVALSLICAATSSAQSGGVARKDASVAVDGVLKQVFRSQRPGRYDYIAQIEVARAELRKRLDANAKVAVPVPGDVIYVHLTQKLDNAGRVIAADSHAGLPAEGSELKVYLAPRAAGGWEGAYPDWVDVVKGDQAGTADLFPPEPTAVNQTGGGGLGLKADVLKVQGRVVLRVTAVERGSPAQEAGIEVGDVIAGANGGELTGADQLDKLTAAGKPFSVIIVDVNSGKPVQVDVNPGRAAAPASAPTPDKPAPTPTPAPQQKVSLGLSAEEVRLGNRSALKVTRVTPDGLGAKAGVEVGDVIVAANGVPTTGPEQLVSALRKSSSKLVLTIRDSRTNKDVDVEIPLGAGKPERPAPTNAGVPVPGTNPNALGVVTELAFHENEFAVSISEVADGSPAAKAGLKPGLLITEANGKPVLHPNELNDAVRNSGGRLKLTVVEPNSGRSASLNLDLR